MKEILVLHLGDGEETIPIAFLGEELLLRRVGTHGSLENIQTCIEAWDGKVAAIALEGMPDRLCLADACRDHEAGQRLAGLAKLSPLVNGSGVRATLERWGVMLAERAQPGIFSQKNILLIPGLNHEGMCQALQRHSPHLRYADPVVYLGLPDFPGAGNPKTLERLSGPILDQLKQAPFRRVNPLPGAPGVKRSQTPFLWADVLAGDIGAIRRYAPQDLRRKTVLVPSATEQDLEDLRQRGVSIAIAIIPEYLSVAERYGSGAATVEAILAALRPDPSLPLSEDTYLDLIANLEWTPDIRYLQPEEAGVNRFAFVIHPLSVDFIHKHPLFGWTRFLPDSLVEWVGAFIPPIYISKVTGGRSPLTGQKVEGYLYSLGATPRQMMRHSDRFTYKRLNLAARMAERKGARIMGLGAFTSVVGDAGITVAREADIAITSGNSLTVAATLEAAKQAMVKMGASDLTHGRVMVIGATGSIGSICARLLAQAIFDVVLVSIEPEKLIGLKQRILEETPGSRVTITTQAGDYVGSCDLIVTATSAFGQRVLDITRCKPGAVICDVARPPDINPAEAALRPDVLVIESGEVLIPGDIDFGYDIGLPPKTAYACLAETALLAMEGRFEDYTIGRDISMERVKEIYRLFKKHRFQLAGLRSFGEYVTDEEIARKRAQADALRQDPLRYERLLEQTAVQIAAIPAEAKGVRAGDGGEAPRLLAGAAVGLAGVFAVVKLRSLLVSRQTNHRNSHSQNFD